MANENNIANKEEFSNGKTVIYDSHGADSQLNERTGEAAEIIRPLGPDECDQDDIGNMYKIRFKSDGYETDAFEDELVLCTIERFFNKEEIKVIAQRNKLNDKRNFVYAVKTAANLYKALQMLESIGIMVEGATEGVGACIWDAITNATNIALLLMNYNIADELANEVFLDLIERYIKNNMTDDDIKKFYASYKAYSNNSAMIKGELKKLESRYNYYCDDCPSKRSKTECDIECESKKESIEKRIKLLCKLERSM